MNDLAIKIQEVLDGLCLEPDEREWGDRGWTHRVKSAVIKLAHEAGHKAYASPADGADGSEWLYDLTWLDYSKEDRILKRTILVLESEWGLKPEEIDWDFHRLLLARADLRVMVFQAKDEEQCQTVFRRLIKLVALNEQAKPGDRYLLSGWIAENRRFKHRHYVHDGS